MWFRNLYECSSGQLIDIRIENEKIRSAERHPCGALADSDEEGIYIDDAMVFPGLINSHDHLDFNNFPQLGNRIYNNYVEWGEDIHAVNKEVIADILSVPKHIRTQWGVYKNLLNGVTTVVNHGEPVVLNKAPISLHQRCHVLHSVQLEKNWRLRLNKPFRKDNDPFVIHIGEGTDKASSAEVKELIRWNLSGRKLIGIHGVNMSEGDARHFYGLVWCPASNYFLYGRAAAIDKLKEKTTIVFGTDSTLSAPWNMWEHLRLARETAMTNDAELYYMLNTLPASLWKLGNTGKIQPEYDADIVIAKRKNGLSGMDAFYALNPGDILLVIHKGVIRLVDESVLSRVSAHIKIADFSRIAVNAKLKYVEGDLTELMGYGAILPQGISFTSVAEKVFL